MLDLYKNIISNPVFFPKQLSAGESLIAEYNCPLKNKMQEAWSEHNYIVYVIEGRKIWHTTNRSYNLTKGSCVFVRKGACIVEQFFDTPFCVVLFFLPDEFIFDVLKSKSTPIPRAEKKYEPVIPVNKNEALESFFHSMRFYFGSSPQPDQSLIELKFREVVLTIADNHQNAELLSYFGSLLHQPQSILLRKIMEDNFHYNLKLEEFAKLTNRSLSAFKRDFQKEFNVTPGKWLLEKRLQHANHLLSNAGKTVSEAAFESGFENVSHFSRSFRNYFGMPPASVKQQVSL